jgi:hypothetical protein
LGGVICGVVARNRQTRIAFGATPCIWPHGARHRVADLDRRGRYLVRRIRNPAMASNPSRTKRPLLPVAGIGAAAAVGLTVAIGVDVGVAAGVDVGTPTGVADAVTSGVGV